MTLVGWLLISVNLLALLVYAVATYRLGQAMRRHRAIADGYVSLLASQGIALWDEIDVLPRL